jgi:UDP-perosamine 4-acetyltransferase
MTGQTIIVGAGGHAKVIIDILQDAGIQPVGCTSTDRDVKDVLGVPVVGGDSELPRLFANGVRLAFIAIGDNRKRMEVSRAVCAIGFQLINAISLRAVVARSAQLGQGIAIMPGVVINACAQIGDGAIINTGATVDHDCIIGDYAHVAPGANLAGCVRVGEGAFLGTGSRAIPDVSVGAWTTVGAGGVIIRNLREHVVAVGVPAVVIKAKRAICA